MGEVQTQTIETEDQVLHQAEALANQDDWKKAALVIENAQATIIISPKARGTMAYYHSRAGDYVKAVALYEELCQLQPAEAKWHYCLGYQFQKKEQWDRAISAYEEALRLFPKWLKVHLTLGQAHELTGRVEKAIEIYRSGLQLYKELPADSRLPLVSIYGKLCRKTADILLSKEPRLSEEVGEALQCLCEGAEATPNDENSWYRLGNLLVDLDRLDEAIEYLGKAEALAPRKEYILS